MLKALGITAIILAAAMSIVFSVFMAMEGIVDAIDQSHKWEEKPDETESEAENEKF